jgi:hypothetical protein
MADPMPGKPHAVRAADGKALAPCHPARARALVRRGRAYFVRRHPPVIRFKPSSEKS